MVAKNKKLGARHGTKLIHDIHDSYYLYDECWCLNVSQSPVENSKIQSNLQMRTIEAIKTNKTAVKCSIKILLQLLKKKFCGDSEFLFCQRF